MHTPDSTLATNKIALPMYDLWRPDTVALGDALRDLLAIRGLPVEQIWPHDDLKAHWQRSDVLLSQTCGYPLVTQLTHVQTVGCFHYLAPGCEGFCYRSWLVVREDDHHKTLADFRAHRAVCNAKDSQSGYRALRKMVAQLPNAESFFAALHISGSHRQSLIDVAQNRADIAAIDCVTWALLKRHTPSVLQGLAVIGQSPLTPGLPLITAQQTSAATLESIRDALRQLVSDAHYQDVCATSLIGGFSEVSRQDYAVLL